MPQSDALSDRLILVVEDEVLVALDLEFAFREQGAQVIAARTLSEAMAMSEDRRIAGAVLDVRIGNEEVFPVAKLLSQRNVPFVFHTAHADTGGDISRAWASNPIVRKPSYSRNVFAALQPLLR